MTLAKVALRSSSILLFCSLCILLFYRGKLSVLCPDTPAAPACSFDYPRTIERRGAQCVKCQTDIKGGGYMESKVKLGACSTQCQKYGESFCKNHYKIVCENYTLSPIVMEVEPVIDPLE